MHVFIAPLLFFEKYVGRPLFLTAGLIDVLLDLHVCMCPCFVIVVVVIVVVVIAVVADLIHGDSAALFCCYFCRCLRVMLFCNKLMVAKSVREKWSIALVT